ncbi:hypothetical protein CKA32_006759 [Geitlerinema sp. FC II]|nr:hypothetical protein CKA32_006759 [Geitlerinema sp. FC II]
MRTPRLPARHPRFRSFGEGNRRRRSLKFVRSDCEPQSPQHFSSIADKPSSIDFSKSVTYL